VVWAFFISGGVQRVVAATAATEADRAHRKLAAMQDAAKHRR